MRFAANDTQYTGEWFNGLMHGKGVFIMANGDRMLGSWTDNRQHGEFQCFSHEALGHEVVSRLGIWDKGTFIKWSTTAISKFATNEFCEHFVKMDFLNAAGDYNASIRRVELHTEFAVNVSSLLPDVPDGVNPDHPVVKFIIHWLARSEASVVGVAAENRLMPLYDQAKLAAAKHFQVLEKAKAAHMDAAQHADDYREPLEKSEGELADVLSSKRKQEMKIESLWQSDQRNSRWMFKQAVNKLREYNSGKSGIHSKIGDGEKCDGRKSKQEANALCSFL